LRRVRQEPSLTVDEVANEMEWSASKMSRVETVARVASTRPRYAYNRVGKRSNAGRNMDASIGPMFRHRHHYKLKSKSERYTGSIAAYPPYKEGQCGRLLCHTSEVNSGWSNTNAGQFISLANENT